ncbi:Structural maintenance of chromosomes protein 4 [Diplonema papillatum]|nr:Structural maintenance of chromosomes protein 4 [Diplonema papillatum]
MAEANAEAGERQSVRRLMIMSMKLENFKSYAGEQKIGPFHKKFSAIVGPNGSGKSNVIDAMLFVFGKKAKQIRLDKIASLIHKSDANPNLREGRVTVYFQEIIDYEDSDSDFDPILGTELSITRSCNIDGQSHYYINNVKSTYLKVTSLLKEKGVDLDHNRFLILQGEVEQIALMKPKAQTENEDGLLEYIEDIIGTQHYKPEIEEGTTLVDQLTEERETHVNRVQVAEKDRDALQGAKEEAEEFLRLEVKLSKERAVFIQLKRQAQQEALEEKKAKEAALSTQLAAQTKRNREVGEELAAMETSVKAEKKRLDILLKQFDKHQEEFRKLDTSSAEHESNVAHAKQAVDKAIAARKKAVAEVAKAEAQIKAAEIDVAKGEKEIAGLKESIDGDTAKADEMTEALQAKLKPLRNRYERLQQELMPHNQEVNAAEEKLKLADQELRMFRNQDDDVQIRLEAQQRRRAEAGSKRDNLEEGMKNDRKELKTRQDQFESDLKRLKKAQAALPEVRAREQTLLASVETLKKQAQEAGSESAVTKALKRLKQQGGLDGYFGRLGDLGAIDDKFGVAISTAAGNSLNCLVVDGEATAKHILQYLKENGTGRASILLLDHQTQQYGKAASSKLDRTAGNLPRLYDLIKPAHPRFAPAFYSAVRDTLVAPSIEEASSIAYSARPNAKPRVVTLAGELIETTGTMTGGGRPASGAGMRSFQISATLKEDLIRQQQELEQATSDGRQLTETLYLLQDKVTTSSARVKELQAIVSSKESEFRHLEGELKHIDAALERVSKEKKEADAAQKREAQRLSELQAAAKAAEAHLQTCKDKRKHLDKEMVSIQAEMQTVGGRKYTDLQNVLRANNERLAVVEQKVSEATATAAAGKKHLDARKKRIAACEKDEEKAKEMQAKLQQHTATDDSRITEAREKVKSVRAQVDEVRGKLDESQKKKEKQKAALNKTKASEVKLQHEHKQAAADLSALREQCDRLTETLQSIDKTLRKSIAEYGTTILDPNEVSDPAEFEAEKYSVIVEEKELGDYDATAVKRNIQRFEESQKKLKPNVKALAEWQEKNNVLVKRSKDLSDVSDRRHEAQTKVDLLKKKRHDEFMTGFRAITYKLKEMYQMLTLGGDAELELVDTFDPFTEGLQFAVRPPKKSWKHISNLSGGEKTLSSLALVFALHHFKPTPVYVMDEIDAALDFKNVSIVANYVKSAASNAQFIIISLRNNMFELANRLIGICKTENCTKSLALNPACFASLLPAMPLEEALITSGGVATSTLKGGRKRAGDDPSDAAEAKARKVVHEDA